MRAPALMPRTLIHVNAARPPTTVAAWPTPWLAPGQTSPTTRAKNTERLATATVRAIHVIQPTSNPTKSPKAARV